MNTVTDARRPDKGSADANTWARDMVANLPPMAVDDVRAYLGHLSEIQTHAEYRRLRHARLAGEVERRGLALDEKPRHYWTPRDFTYGRLFRVIDQSGRPVVSSLWRQFGAWGLNLDDLEEWLGSTSGSEGTP